MKTIKRILLGLLGLIVLALIAAIFTKKDYAVERHIEIERPRLEVYNFIRLLRNQDQFSVWNRMDPSMKKTYSGIDGKVGFIATWDSKNKDLGKGEQEITGVSYGRRLDTKLRFKEPFDAEDDAYLITEDDGNTGTLVKWGFKGRMTYPMNIMLLFMDMDDMIGKDLQTGLINLKTVLEDD
ncbi:hypothetical protein PBAL39_01777 [Pedobacter sp. BAL39]|uniref:SRPBCC family protein n=1 Tax=Pedobacter sp. BAL39 TaxID=391596 RepID=UPI000155999E|nr:SRPBCC family protein [Pedobacter sp. BAL39]EDM38304.1 hypothetical protein PBAL39_01777 [Pedobacter sp. BAL39]